MSLDPVTLIVGAAVAGALWLVLGRGRARRPDDAPPRLRLETLPRDAREEMLRMLAEGRRVDAVRTIRAKAGVSLKEAKEFVDQVEREQG